MPHLIVPANSNLRVSLRWIILVKSTLHYNIKYIFVFSLNSLKNKTKYYHLKLHRILS
jgi:hypothetical protein